MENGVKFYTRARVNIYFPEGRVCCKFCPVLETYAREQCRLTGEYLADTRGIGSVSYTHLDVYKRQSQTL